MSLYSYRESQKISLEDYSFDALIFAAIRKSDTFNAMALKRAFPELFDEFFKRYNAPGGKLEHERRQSED